MLTNIRAFAQQKSRLSVLRLVLAFILGASTALSFAPYSLWIIYPVAMALALWLSGSLSSKASFFHWLSFGFGCFAVGISWVHVSMDTFGGLPLAASVGLMALLALYLALYPALTGLGLAWLTRANTPSLWRNLLLFPALWVLTEWARGWVMTGFPWIWAGYSQTQGPLKELASIIGALGLSFLIAMLAGALALCFSKRYKSLLILLPIIAVAAWTAPKLTQIKPTGESVKVALVQGNIPQSMKWEPEALWPTLLKYMDLSREHFDADIIVWPEAAIPAPESMVQDFLDNANKVANLNHTSIITGIISRQHDEFYNSLIVLGNHNQKQQDTPDYESDGSNQFKKHHLLPIGEFVPFEALLRPIAPFFNLPMSSFARGDYQQPNLSAVGHKIAPAICYEIAFPEQLRDSVNLGTDLLLTVSNDAWFGTSNGPLQHMEIAQMRAIELGRPLVRATNNGVTAVVDEHGNITAALPQFETGVLSATIPLVTGQTWFAKIGQTPLLLLCGALLLVGFVRRQKQQ
ncbi:apolipoprotein N-acyltransferase [Shewanella xiamenensis]|uniref:apolipoprotein N-acyltransferase n=1 Tax=Shewanella xiamenensis TaxID=332186 RepID=UPI0016689162|nr:apolipoprotein N-acyltransferase [Shewanella xiamenensis]MCL1070137.1 apolipoprotein N-acyltransferase [Shewanella xiamenensis]WHF56663.1 apolipoprotein N-acyltransferase [Shewanella xiamenensis]GGM86239.1 apolipoprotein N-acyltransferase [Shewanella xiamenensis]